MQTELKAEPHPGQLVVHMSPERFKVLSAGRRWGKTRLGVNECIDAASRGGRAWWVAPTYKDSEMGWRPLREIARQLPGVEIRISDKQVIFPNGGFVAVRSAEKSDGLRGEGLDFVVMDECASMRKTAWTEEIRPALTDRKGKALFIGTPKGRNHFFELFQKGERGEEDWKSWRFPTVSNPKIDPKEVEAAKRDLPEVVFRQEYLAEFVDNAGSVFRNVEGCAVLEPREPEENRVYVAGADIANAEDFTVIAIIDAETKEMVHQERFNRVDYPILEARIIGIYKRWHLKSIKIEVNGIGQGVIDHLRREGIMVIPFMTNNSTKQAIIQNLQVAFEQNSIKVLNDRQLKNELLNYEEKRTQTGAYIYNAPKGQHDDCVMALAIAWDNLQGEERRFEPIVIFNKDPMKEIDKLRDLADHPRGLHMADVAGGYSAYG